MVTVGDAGEQEPAAPATAHPLQRILFIVAFAIAAGGLASLLGWDIRGWFEQVWDTLRTIAVGYIVAGVVALTVQTAATAYAWYAILRYAYPGELRWRQMLAAYAACVALNNVLPANLGTIVMFVMLTTLMPSATFAGLLGGFAVEKIFFTVAGIFVYLYLFLSVGGSFGISFSFITENPAATVALLIGGAVVLFLTVRSFWPRVLRWWGQAKEGGQILAHPGAYLSRVFVPSFVAWVANLFVIAIFLAAYAIPVTFHTVMTVVGGNSIANTVAVTPGGVGVQQTFNVASLNHVTDSQTATAYSVAQQLITTAWSIIFAIALMIWVFGWGEGRALLEQSYDEAKRRAAEEKAARGAKKTAAEGGKRLTTPARFAAGRAALVCLAAIVAAIVGVLGTWRSAGSLSLDDLEAPQNGWLVVIFGSRRNCLPALPSDGASLAKPPGAGV